MSIASPFGSNRATSTVDVQQIRTLAARPIEAAGFWAAILIPLAYPALLFGGLDGQGLTLLILAAAANVVALYAGRNHNRDDA